MRAWLRVWRPPGWALALIALFAASEPIAHLWIRYALPGAWLPTGMRISDDPFFLTAMRLYAPGFTSPYVVGETLTTAEHRALDALPHHHLYALLGVVVRGAGLVPQLALGLANGAAAALYLLAVWAFFRAAVPRHASGAFALYCLPGGLAGLGLGGMWLSGAIDAAGLWEDTAWLLARYELIEGPSVAPMLHLPRLYYTLALAAAYAALALLIAGRKGIAIAGATCLLVLATLLNARVGPIAWFGAVAWITLAPNAWPLSRRAWWSFLLAVPVAVTLWAVSGWFTTLNPEAADNVWLLLRRAAWFGSVVTLLALHLPILALPLWRAARALPPVPRALSGAAMGYLLTFAIGYALYKLYAGTLGTSHGERAAVLAVTDPALGGALLGAVAMFAPLRAHAPRAVSGWAVFWLLALLAPAIALPGAGLLRVFTALSPSAAQSGSVVAQSLGQLTSAYAALMPERLLVMLGAPLALLTAEVLGTFTARSRALAYAGLLSAGALSAVVGYGWFQGPLGNLRDGDYHITNPVEAMHPADANIIRRIPSGSVVLAPATLPPLFGDIIVLNVREARTPLGQPSLEFARTDMARRIDEVIRFYRNEIDQRALLRRWGVQYVYVPTTLNDFGELPKLDALLASGLLVEVARDERAARLVPAFDAQVNPAGQVQAGAAVLYRVKLGEL